MEDSPSAESGPSHLGPAKGGTGGCSSTAAGMKRKPELGPTPPRGNTKTKKKRIFTPAGQTFRQAEKDNLLGVVLVQGHPYTVLSRVQLDRVRERLLQGIEAAIDSDNTSVPRFNETGVRHGRLHLSCKDDSTFQWLQSAVADITLSSDDTDDTLQLQLVTPAEVPKLLRAEVYISGPPPGVPKFKKLLQGQNPRLHLDRLVLRHQQSSAQSMLMVWSIDKESADALFEVGDRPHFGLGRATFRVSRGPGPGEVPSH